MTKRLLGALAVFLAVAVTAHADFASLARTIDAQQGVKRMWIPFLGLARTLVKIVEPNGVNDFQVVVFKGAANLDPREIHALMRREAGPGFRPLVQAHSRRKGEWSFIYARPHADRQRVELLIFAHDDDDDTVLVRVDVDPDVLAKEMNHPVRMGRMARR